MNDIKKLVAEVVVTLNSKLTNATTQDASERYAIINDTLNHAFKQVASVQPGETEQEQQIRETERKQLYRQLGLIFHPDKIIHNTEPFAIMLTRYKCEKDAQQIVESYKEKSFFANAIASSSYTTESLTNILVSMMKRQDEYPEFIQSDIKLVSSIIMLAGVGGLLLESFLASLVIVITQSTLQSLTNGLTNGKFNELLADFENNYPLDYKLIRNQVITDLKSGDYTVNCQSWVEANPNATPDEIEARKAEIYQGLFSLSDADYLDAAQVNYNANGIPNHFTDTLSEAILNTDFNRAQFVMEALIRTVSVSIETDTDLDFAIALITRSLLVTAAIIIIPLTFLAESVIKFVVQPVANMIIPGLLFMATATVLLTLNLPIYTCDLIIATIDYLSTIIHDCLDYAPIDDSEVMMDSIPTQQSPRTPSGFEFFSAEATVKEEIKPQRVNQPTGPCSNMAEID